MDHTLILVLIDALKAAHAANQAEALPADDQTMTYTKRHELQDEARVLVRAALRLAHQCGEMPQEPAKDSANLKAVA